MIGRHGPCLAAFIAVSFMTLRPSIGQESGPGTLGPPALYPVERSGEWGYVDDAERHVVPARFEEARDFTGGTARVRIGSAETTIDRRGKVLDGRP